MTTPPRAAAPPQLNDVAYRSIKRRIIRLELPPGGSFSESQVATALGMTKAPVRHALVRLGREGLVTAAARSGYRVAPITLKDCRDMFALRLILEPEAAALAAVNLRDPAELLRLEELCNNSYTPDDADSIDRFLRANTEFHHTVALAGGNQRLAEVIRQLLEQMERLFHLGMRLLERSDQMIHDHQELLRALIASDQDAARRITVAAIHSVQEMVLEAMLSSPSLSSINLSSARADEHAPGSPPPAISKPARSPARNGRAARRNGG